MHITWREKLRERESITRGRKWESISIWMKESGFIPWLLLTSLMILLSLSLCNWSLKEFSWIPISDPIKRREREKKRKSQLRSTSFNPHHNRVSPSCSIKLFFTLSLVTTCNFYSPFNVRSNQQLFERERKGYYLEIRIGNYSLLSGSFMITLLLLLLLSLSLFVKCSLHPLSALSVFVRLNPNHKSQCEFNWEREVK